MHRFQSFTFLAALILIAVFWVPSIAEACPGCKEALASNDPQQASIVRGYFWSILFMMSMPFVVIGSFALYMWREVRRARLTAAAANATSPANPEPATV